MSRKPYTPPEPQLDLLNPPPPVAPRRRRKVSRTSDTQAAAHDAVKPAKSWIHDEIMNQIRSRGGMTDGELELLAAFVGLAPTTVRARRCELLNDERIQDSGQRRGHPLRPRSNMKVWVLAEKKEAT